MTSQERIDRYDAQYRMLLALTGPDLGGTPACTDEDPELFFPVSEEHEHQIAQAKSVCQACPVQGSCLQFAVRTGQHGIWGGTTEEERRKIILLRRQDRNEVAETGGKKRGEAA